MTLRKRYVVFARSGAHILSGESKSHMMIVDNSLKDMGVHFISEAESSDDKVAFLTEEQAETIRGLGDVLIEEDLQCHLLKDPVLNPFNPLRFLGSNPLTIQTVDKATSHPVPFVTVYLFVDWQARSGYKITTDANGRAVLDIAPSHKTFELTVAYPKMNYWNKFMENVAATFMLKIELQQLTVDNTARWGIELTRTPAGRGKGVRVGVIDSGIWRDHPNLKPTGGCNFISEEPADEWWNDEDGHGTHVAGVISAGLASTGGIDGYAPDAEVLAYRVFGGPDGGGHYSTISKAIQQAINDKCDIINLSLGGSRSNAMRAKLEAAAQSGILCVAAAGNSGGNVEYPAAFDEVLAVSALGKFGIYPSDSLHVREQSSRISRDNTLYAARFTCYGKDVELTAPGVAVLSTIPPDGFAAWNGTSMACPHIVGLAAALLSGRSDILNLPRDDARAEAIKQMILQCAQDIGLPAEYQGCGLPQVP